MSSNTENNDNNDHRFGGSGEMTSSIKEYTSCEQSYVDTITEDINSISMRDDTSVCASCGKEGNSDMNTCNKCQLVKYCNAACKKKHRKKHKKACEKRVAELHEEQLFKDHPPREECPICMLPLPFDLNESVFKPCCGKFICKGCICTMVESVRGVLLCPFCRTPNAKNLDEHIERTRKLMEKGDVGAFNHLAGYYANGTTSLPQDMNKAKELWLKAGELGYAEAYCNLGMYYENGVSVERDEKKAKHYFELAAMGGDIHARNNLGYMEFKAGNFHRSLKHFILTAKAGDEKSLRKVKIGYKVGSVTKDEYASTLRAYHERQKEMKSDARDKAAASDIFNE